MTFVVKAATLSAFRSARDADDESVASRNGRAMDRVAPAIATRGGEFIDRRLMLMLCGGGSHLCMVGNDFDGVWSGRPKARQISIVLTCTYAVRIPQTS